MAHNGSGDSSSSHVEPNIYEIDPSRTARQIYALGDVEKDISRLLSLAASSISLLTLPQTDGPDDNLSQGDERSEQFVLEVSEYFERLDAIQIAIRSSLAHIRQSRIAPSAIDAPPPGFVPSVTGADIPPPTNPGDGNLSNSTTESCGLQEERIERDAWRGALDALTRIRDQRSKEFKENEDMADATAFTG
ncbi:hypothetical protein HETIRDRAFT_406701 [Heterobasidion irregulare TC 32-1]|uniref:Mediator of RNA polymerase II transcription subunit 11 n=1 Tax=Heterobasidion irregulare (strain TC 32-1) TaxID=747525 RepID=W4KP76_HETIT|nr:uncharacterized protein HETIRDRAFT_406701 [Heterobasidion irregulare TC 32-1]ETW86831.1 hypothetical protein HETIRDRAFT_406701 [Heterobasidion irregulare TC 32-1]